MNIAFSAMMPIFSGVCQGGSSSGDMCAPDVSGENHHLGILSPSDRSPASHRRQIAFVHRVCPMEGDMCDADRFEVVYTSGETSTYVDKNTGKQPHDSFKNFEGYDM